MATAAANTIHVDIVSAEGEIFSGAASMVFAPGTQGELGIAPRHAPLLTLLKAGEVRVQTPDGQEQQFFVGGGALEIQPNKVSVLADTALRAKDLDEAAALAAKQRAEEALHDGADKMTQAEALKEIVRATEQLKMIQKLRKVKG
jgi:F-type H+-transporting ATPase subunit epsilon